MMDVDLRTLERGLCVEGLRNWKRKSKRRVRVTTVGKVGNKQEAFLCRRNVKIHDAIVGMLSE